MLFSKKPGMHERHAQRKYNNPLFKDNAIDQQDIHLAQQKDQQAIALFMAEFRQLVQRTVELEANVDADIILKLKEDLDKCYEKSAGLADDQHEIQSMIKRLLDTIMKTMWAGIGNDAEAKEKLEMEEQARTAHFTLLEYPLVADLLQPDNIIDKDELAATLLTTSTAELESILPLFTLDQQNVIIDEAMAHLNQLGLDHPVYPEIKARIEQMKHSSLST